MCLKGQYYQTNLCLHLKKSEIAGEHLLFTCMDIRLWMTKHIVPKLSPALLIIWWYPRFVIWGYLVIFQGSMTECVMVVLGHQRVLGELERTYNSIHAYQQRQRQIQRVCYGGIGLPPAAGIGGAAGRSLQLQTCLPTIGHAPCQPCRVGWVFLRKNWPWVDWLELLTSNSCRVLLDRYWQS